MGLYTGYECYLDACKAIDNKRKQTYKGLHMQALFLFVRLAFYKRSIVKSLGESRLRRDHNYFEINPAKYFTVRTSWLT